mgnify:CR=1 FL=1
MYAIVLVIFVAFKNTMVLIVSISMKLATANAPHSSADKDFIMWGGFICSIAVADSFTKNSW